ncbi:MAG: ANTAR domain-containing protein [Chloroflexaceae bacterium]|nr:ANTAR domain-containing protein [Chloroflexaceae bacterium]NJO07684.1 ANTAR domain-containing protein [Chloroflexaceae bacterium]
MSEIRILLADEDVRSRDILRKALDALDYLVIGEVADGSSVVSLTRQLLPDLVMMDAHVSHTSALVVAETLRNEHLAPIIMMAQHGDRELVEAAREVGVLGFLVKPIKKSELLPTIEVIRARWVEQHARRQELSQLRDKLETRKVIERAKGYLMDSQGLQEAEAFRKIQRLAMNSRKTMREVAQAILLAQQLKH